MVENNLPPTAWVVSNRQPYEKENEPSESLLLAGPATIERFVTTPSKHQGCSITRLGPGACEETAEATTRVLHHLEAVLDKRLQVLVCDFTRDDLGKIWFLQVSRDPF